MKLVITVLLCAAAACSRESRPQTAQAVGTTTSPLQTALVASPQPGAQGIPRDNPQVAPPQAEASPPADETPLTPASGLGGPRPTSAQVATPNNPALDHADSPTEQESLREIRELLARDQALSATARQVTIVVRDGRVWLRGQVNTAEQRAAIERAARQAAGVVDVRNELVVME